MARVAVACAAHASDSIQHRRVYFEIVNETFGKVKTQDITQYQNAASRAVAKRDNLANAAFHFGQGFFNHRCLDHRCGLNAHPGKGEFVDLRWNVCCGLIHGLGQMFANNVDDKDTARFEVAKRVFFVVAGRFTRWGETDHWRVARNRVKEAVWCKVVGAVFAYGGDPGDGSGDHYADHELVEVFRAGVFRFDDHCGAVFRLTLDWKE